MAFFILHIDNLAKKSYNEAEVKLMAKEDDGFYLWARGTRPEALKREEMDRLLREYRKYGDPKVREKIIYGSLGLVQSCVNRLAPKYVGCLDQINPTKEDLYEMGVQVLIEALDKYDPENYKYRFTTHIARRIDWRFARMRSIKEFHSPRVMQSLNEPLKNSAKSEESKEILDKIPSKEREFDFLHDKLEVEYIKKEILPLLTKREREIFVGVVINGEKEEVFVKKYGLTKATVSRFYTATLEKVKRMYFEGPTPLEKELRGVSMTQYQLDRIEENKQLFEKYGREFLRQYFLPTLTPRLRGIFSELVLNYRGQEMQGVYEKYGFLSRTAGPNSLTYILERLPKRAQKLKEMQAKGLLPKPWTPTLKQQQKINKNERYINEYGGRYFLQKYFLPILADSQKVAFTLGVLEYCGQTKIELAQTAGISTQAFNAFLKQAKDKLALVDFDAVVDFVDGKTAYEMRTKTQTKERIDFEKVQMRREYVLAHGGKEKLARYFLPILPELQRQVFNLLYIEQAFATINGVAQILGVNGGTVCAAEKIAREKLESTNLDELEKIDKEVEQFLKLRKGEKIGLKTHQYGSGRQKVLDEYGGALFMRDVLIPRLSAKVDREICERFFVQGQIFSQFKDILSYGRQRDLRSYTEEVGDDTKVFRLKRRIVERILPELQEIKRSYEDFDKEVKEYYLKKAFQTLHPEEFEKITFESMQKILEEREKYKDTIITPELIEKAGGELVVLRKIRPGLKVTQQIILLKTIQKETTEQISQDIGLSQDEVLSEKRGIKGKIEDFICKNAEKSVKK